MGFMGSGVISSQYNVPSADGVYGVFIAPQRDYSLGINTSVMCIAGTAIWGIPGTLLPFGSSLQSRYDAFGAAYPLDVYGNPDVHSILSEANNAMDPGFGNQIGYGSRVTDNTDVAAEIDVLDSAQGVVCSLTAVSTGTRGNSGACYIVENALSTDESPVFDISLSIANGATETFYAIPAYAVAGGGYNSSQWQTNFVAAVNNGTSLRAASIYWLASAGASQNIPVFGTYSPTSALGTDGNLGVTTNMLLGSPAPGNNLGLYVFAPVVSGGQFCIAGLTDESAASAMAAFGLSTLSVPVNTFASGTSTADAVAIKSANGMLQAGALNVQDWLTVYDQVLGTYRLMSPLGHTLGQLASTPPEGSPGNKPLATTIVSTDRSASPVVAPENSIRTTAGITWWTTQYPLNGNWGLANGQNAGAVSQGPSSGINFTRMSYFCMLTAFGVLAPFLEQLQGNDAAEDTVGTRAQVNAALSSKFGTLAAQRRLSSAKITVNASNNPSTSVNGGFMFAYIKLEFMQTVRYIVPIIDRNGNLFAQIQSTSP